MPQRTNICDLAKNQLVDGVYAIQNCQLGQTRTGKPFLKCLLADRTGRTPGRMWNASQELYATLPTDGFVWLEGQAQPYQGEIQIIIHKIESARPTEEQLLDLLPRTEHDIDEMFAELGRILQTIEHAPLAALIRTYLDDQSLMERFRRAPAAMTLHHAFIGGLLEHTLQLLKVADPILPSYPKLNRDVVLAGLFLHDLGKCEELKWESGFDYTDDGRLVGHIARGVIRLEAKAKQCGDAGGEIPPPLLRVLTHIILSHHGKPEHGAQMVPATPEAIFVSLMDNLDAKVNMAISATRNDKSAKPGGDFTEKIWALETRLYRPDPTKENQENKRA